MKTSGIRRIAARENSFSLHHGGQIEGIGTPRTSQHYRIAGFKGSPLNKSTNVDLSSVEQERLL